MDNKVSPDDATVLLDNIFKVAGDVGIAEIGRPGVADGELVEAQHVHHPGVCVQTSCVNSTCTCIEVHVFTYSSR